MDGSGGINQWCDASDAIRGERSNDTSGRTRCGKGVGGRARAAMVFSDGASRMEMPRPQAAAEAAAEASAAARAFRSDREGGIRGTGSVLKR